MAELTQNQFDARSLTDFYRPTPFNWRRDCWRPWRWARPQLAALSLVLLVVVLVVNGLAWEPSRHSPGPVAGVHASWEGNCAACHGSPTSDTAFGGVRSVMGVESARCQTCHAGPSHHANATDEPGCASCHREHHGRQARLTRVADEHCLNCHDNLTGDHKIARFSAKAHPEFREFRESQPNKPSLASQQKLHFSHALHMTPGLVDPNTDGSQSRPRTYADVAAEDRPRYQGKQPPTARVQLTCASCHQLDGSEAPPQLTGLPNGRWPARSPGAYPLPVSYAAHCRACHPLTFDEQTPNLHAPHGQQPAEVRQFLERTYAAQLLLADAQHLERWLPVRPQGAPLPGKLPAETVKVGDLLRKKVAATEQYLFREKAACGQCHVYEGQPVPVRILPTKVPDVWLEHARFNHTAHRALDCRACHPAAFPTLPDGKVNPGASSRSSDVLLPGINNCLQCHNTAGKATVAGWGGAAANCTTCHNYHHGDIPRAGVGASQRQPRQRIDPDRFLRGGQ